MDHTVLDSYRRSTYCSQVATQKSNRKGLEDSAGRVDRILSKTALCPHDIDEISFIYKRCDQREREVGLHPGEKISSLIILGKVQERIKSILSASYCSSQDFINLYYLSHFSHIAPRDVSITELVLETRQKKGVSFNKMSSIASDLPYCVSKASYEKDLRFLLGPYGEAFSIQEIIERPMDILDLDTALRKRRAIFLENDPGNYPTYLDQILKRGFLYLYDYLLKTKEPEGKEKSPEELLPGISDVSRVILNTRDAIFYHVKQQIPPTACNIVFLVGNTGAGKSTTFAFLSGRSLGEKGNAYELSSEKDLISNSLSESQTFLPNVKVIGDTVYVDMPGFKDSRGDAIALGIELGFKALVSQFKPKILVVESINALYGSRGGFIRELGGELRRMLGDNINNCQLAITKYRQMSEHVEWKASKKEKNRITQQIENLDRAMEKKGALILQIKEDIKTGSEKACQVKSQEIEDLEEDIEDLEERIEGLNEKKEKGALNEREAKKLQKLLAKLENKREKLQALQEGSNLFPEKEILEAQIGKEIKDIELIKRERKELIREWASIDQEIEDKEKSIKTAEEVLTEMLGIKRKPIRLDDLNNREMFDRCTEVLDRMLPVQTVCKELSIKHAKALVDLIKNQLTGRELPPPPSVEVDDLRSRILETSLINVLTEKLFPEVARLLHLPDIDIMYAEEIDNHIITDFADTLIRIIILGHFKSESEKPEDPIVDFIENLIEKIGTEYEKEASALKSEWTDLKKMIVHVNKDGAKTWSDLQKSCAMSILDSLDRSANAKDTHLKEWDEWASNILGIPLKLPDWVYRPIAERAANKKLIENLRGFIRDLNESFEKIKDLEKIVANKRLIAGYWEKFRCSLSSPPEFLTQIDVIINQARDIYNQGSKESEKQKPWDRRIGKALNALSNKMKPFSDLLGSNPFLLDLMIVELCGQSQSEVEFASQMSALASSANKKQTKGRFSERQFQLMALASSTALQLEGGVELETMQAVGKEIQLAAELAMKERLEKALDEIPHLFLTVLTTLQQGIQVGKLGPAKLAEAAGIGLAALGLALPGLVGLAEAAQGLDRLAGFKMARKELSEILKESEGEVDVGEKEKKVKKSIKKIRGQVLYEFKILADLLNPLLENAEKIANAAGVGERLLNGVEILELKEEDKNAMLALVDTEKSIIEEAGERILLNPQKERSVLSQIRMINNEFASNLGLNLSIELHRIILLSLLNQLSTSSKASTFSLDGIVSSITRPRVEEMT